MNEVPDLVKQADVALDKSNEAVWKYQEYRLSIIGFLIAASVLAVTIPEQNNIEMRIFAYFAMISAGLAAIVHLLLAGLAQKYLLRDAYLEETKAAEMKRITNGVGVVESSDLKALMARIEASAEVSSVMRMILLEQSKGVLNRIERQEKSKWTLDGYKYWMNKADLASLILVFVTVVLLGISLGTLI